MTSYLSFFDAEAGVSHCVGWRVADSYAQNDVSIFGQKLQYVGQRKEGNVNVIFLKERKKLKWYSGDPNTNK